LYSQIIAWNNANITSTGFIAATNKMVCSIN